MKDTEKQIFACASDADVKLDVLRCSLSQNLDIERLIRVAMKEGLSGFLYRSFLKSGMLEALGPQQRATLESSYYQTALSNLKLIHAAKEMLHGANTRKIKLVLVQGMDLLHTVYEDVGVRPMTDVDLWINERDFTAVVTVFRQLGYSQDSIYPTIFRRGSVTFDIHTHLLWANRIKSRRRLLKIDEKDIFAKTRSVLVDGEQALCLNPCDQFIYLGLHSLKHRARRLMWMVDLKTLVSRWQESEWTALTGRAKELGREKTVSHMLFLLRHLLGFHPSAEVHSLPRLSSVEKKVLTQRILGDALTPWGSALLLCAGQGLAKTLPLLLESLFPRPEVLRQMFPELNHLRAPWLYLKRAGRLLGILVKE